MPFTISLCCNDPDNGNWVGKAEFIEIEDISLQGPDVTVNYYPGKKHRHGDAYNGENTLRVGRLTVPALGYQTWVGNWCWDAARVRAVSALRILNYLIKRGWHCEEAPCAMYEAINKGQPLTAKEWKRLHDEGQL